MIPVSLLTIGQIRNMKRENNDFSMCLLFLVHSGCVSFSMVATALLCRINDGILTILTILLLSAYAGIDFYIRLFFDRYSKTDFTIITLRLGFVLIMIIILIPWTCVISFSYRTHTTKATICSRTILFSWFLNFDSMMILSILTLNIRSQADFGQQQLLILFIGATLTFLWFLVGKILTNNASRHWVVWTVFYTLAITQISHLAYITYWSNHEYSLLSTNNANILMPLLATTFVCGGISVLVHFLTITISFSLFCVS